MARQLFPVFVDLHGRRVLVVGAGSVAAAKLARLLAAGADVVVVAPDVHRDVERLGVAIRQRPFQSDDLDGVWYVVSAAPPEVNAVVLREATARGIFVNAVDDPRNATAYAGSVFTRGPVTVALSTGGDAPALARVLREALEQLIGRNVEDWVALTAQLRCDWKRQEVPMNQRRDALLAALAHLHAERNGVTTGRTDAAPGPTAKGFVSLVGAGPGDPELLTRKAARRLAEADLVLYDALVSPAVVSLADRAQQIMVGRRSGTATTGQDAIIRTMIRAARRGKRVVRLKGGDPFVFGRGGEEALALRVAGIAFEVVPGISSSLAAAASAYIPLTHRGLSTTVVITSGHDLDRFSQTVGSVSPTTTTLVVMMGTSVRGEIAEALLAAGWPPTTPAAIIRDATLPQQTVWSGMVETLATAPHDSAPGTIVVGRVVALRDALLTGVPSRGSFTGVPFTGVHGVQRCH
jgi:uroporphyrin-III C-methyltransferase/precorrin-2 dehydrogenase/sirohydrochlorin ferrochelatase